MKFTNGFWLLRQGVSAYPCMDVRDMEIAKESVTLYVTPWKIFNRGQTLAGPYLTLKFAAPQEGILHLKMSHYEGTPAKGPNYPYADAKCPLTVENSEKEIVISTGKLKAHITKEPFQIEYRYDGKFLTSSGHKQLAYMTTPDGPYCRERLLASVDENFYGFGEYFTPFVKNGQVVDIWNEDGGTCSEQAYKTVPFYLSNRGYGVFVNHPEKVSFEVCSEVVSKVQFSVPGEYIEYMIIGGNNPADALSRYTSLTGRPALPPLWSYGLWLSTSFTTNYNEETVTSFIDGMAERNIPLSVFHFDCFWMKEYQWCNFAWDTDSFPDPEGMLKRLKAKGLKICLWINPYIGQRSPLFAEGAEKGYFIKNAEGGVWQWDMWQPGLAIVDFTNPAAGEWYKDHLRRLMAMGVDCFKTDFGERIPVDGVYFDGSCPHKMHNYYAFQYNQLVFDVVEEVQGKNNAVLFARSATAGSQQFPVHWGGDCDSTYEAMAESLRGGLSLSLCGFGYWSHDIGGFENTATPDVYKRWVAFGLLSSHSRLHGSTSYRVPWLFDEEAVDVLRFFTELKASLMPYIFANAVCAHKTGIPMMRPMMLSFADDPVCPALDTQYMLGESLLVAPIFNEEGARRVYLPQADGQWTNWFTGEKSCGGKFMDEKHDYFSLGLWVRPNSIIAMENEGKPSFHVFEAQNAEAVLCDENGNEILKIKVVKSGDSFTITASENKHGINVIFRNPEKVVNIPAGSTEIKI
ncbi:MAG: alpha-xylosidase [Defluviitaleaceae bacterium]|nr:alpha-xylosidase [Defluviitaleaceae bacterium]